MISVPYLPSAFDTSNSGDYHHRVRVPWFWSPDGTRLFFYTTSGEHRVSGISSVSIENGKSEQFYVAGPDEIVGVTSATKFDEQSPLIVFNNESRTVSVIKNDGTHTTLKGIPLHVDTSLDDTKSRYTKFLIDIELREDEKIGYYQFSPTQAYLCIFEFELADPSNREPASDTAWWHQRNVGRVFAKGEPLVAMMREGLKGTSYDPYIDRFVADPSDPYTTGLPIAAFGLVSFPAWNCDGTKLAVIEHLHPRDNIDYFGHVPIPHFCHIVVSSMNKYVRLNPKRKTDIQFEDTRSPGDTHLENGSTVLFFEDVIWSPNEPDELLTIMTTTKLPPKVRKQYVPHEQSLVVCNDRLSTLVSLYTVKPNEEPIMWPSWSYDGKHVAFTRFNNKTRRSEIVILSMDTPDEIQVVEGNGNDISAIWAPSDLRLAILSVDTTKEQRIDLYQYQTNKRETIARFVD